MVFFLICAFLHDNNSLDSVVYGSSSKCRKLIMLQMKLFFWCSYHAGNKALTLVSLTTSYCNLALSELWNRLAAQATVAPPHYTSGLSSLPIIRVFSTLHFIILYFRARHFIELCFNANLDPLLKGYGIKYWTHWINLFTRKYYLSVLMNYFNKKLLLLLFWKNSIISAVYAHRYLINATEGFLF